MKKFLLLLGLLSTFCLPASAALPAFDSRDEPLPSLAPMLEQTVPSVVNIFTRTRVPVRQHPLFNDPYFRHFFNTPEQPRERVAQSLGSGVILDADKGYIVTNHHVIDGAHEISVNLSDGRTLQAEPVGSDAETDIAVIRVPPESLQAVTLADSSALRVGDFVVAIGNPFGLGQTVTSGIVSAVGRTGLGIEGYEDFIQTDASINPGNSGGALVNLRGELVGINTAIISQGGGNVGIGFAIPSNMARSIMEQLIEYGEVRRGILGVQAQDLTPELARAFDLEMQRGAVVTRVQAGSPADRAGLKSGDIITRFNGRTMRDSAEIRNAIGLLRIGQQVEMEIIRNGKTQTLRATIEQPRLSTLAGEKLHPRLAGAILGEITEGMPQFGKLEGVILLDVVPGSPAWHAGLRDNDVIVQANRQTVTSLEVLQKAGKGRNASLLLNVQRREGALFILLQ